MGDNRDAPRHGIRALCPTRWTVRGNALESILDHWSVLCQLWEQCLDTRLVPDVKARIIGVKSQMISLGLLCGMHLSKTILKHTDNLSRTLQKQSMSAAEGQGIAELTVSTLQRMRSDEAFDQFFVLWRFPENSLMLIPHICHERGEHQLALKLEQEQVAMQNPLKTTIARSTTKLLTCVWHQSRIASINQDTNFTATWKKYWLCQPMSKLTISN